MSPQWHGKRCKHCGGIPEEVGPISGSGKCEACARERNVDNLTQLIEHKGPQFEHWRRRLAASVGAQLPDDDRLTA
jgi:hypothetical protein